MPPWAGIAQLLCIGETIGVGLVVDQAAGKSTVQDQSRRLVSTWLAPLAAWM